MKKEVTKMIKNVDNFGQPPNDFPLSDVRAEQNAHNDTIISVDFGLGTSSMLTYSDQN